MVVVFSLMSNGKNSDCLLIFNFEQRHVSGSAEWDEQFSQEWIRILDFATGERKFLEDLPSTANSSQRSFRCLQVVLGQEGEQPFKI